MRTLLLASASALAISMAGAAYAADLVIEEPAPVVVPVMDWTGPYIGGQIGWGSGTVFWNFVDDPFEDDEEYDLEGWILGVRAGYNWQMDGGFVLGVEGDLNWTNIEGDDEDFAFFDEDDVHRSIDWTGSLRGRAGFGFDTVLVYGTAGFAFAASSADAFADEFGGSDSNTHVGWTIGVGAEVLVTDNMSVTGEYRFSSYGSEEYNYGDIDPIDTGFDTNTFTVGLNFRF